MNRLTDKLLFQNVKRLPPIDWNIKFFGAHTQMIERNWEIKADKHMAFELILILQGQETVKIEGKTYLLTTDDILLIPPNYIHDLKVSKGHLTTYFCCHFDITDPEFSLALIESNTYYFKADTKNNQEIRKYIDQWIQLFYLKEDEFTIKMKELIILSEFLISLRTMVTKRKEIKDINLTTIKLASRILEDIQEEFDTVLYTEGDIDRGVCDIQISEIIKHLGITPEHGSAIFKNAYGVSPRRHLTNLIIKEASSLLQKPDLTIDEISGILGYSSPSHFSRQFKRWTKYSPRAYRNKFFEQKNES